MRSNFAKIFLCLLGISLIANIAMPGNVSARNYDASKAKFAYTSETVVRDTANDANFSLTSKDPYANNAVHGASERIFGSNHYAFLADFATQSDQLGDTRFVLSVFKTTPSKGTLYMYSGALGWSLVPNQTDISISGDGPGEATYFKPDDAGVVGKVKWEDPDNLLEKGGFSINDSGGTSDVLISLLDPSQAYNNDADNGGGLESGSVFGWDANSPPGDTKYNRITLSQINDGKGLAEGRYRLQYNWSNKGTDCSSGDHEFFRWHIPFSETCKLSVYGTVAFEIDHNGYIHINSQDKDELNSPANKDKNPNAKKITEIKTADDGINILLRVSLSNQLKEALAQTIKWLSTAITTMTDRLSGWIEEALKQVSLSDMEATWMKVRNISIGLLMLGIIIIVFANVLSIDIDRYGAQRLIPRLVMNVLFAFFSLLIIKVLLEVSNILQMQFRALITSSHGVAVPFHLDVENLSATELVAQLGTVIFLFIMLIGVVIALFYLFLVLLARIVAIKFLLVAAPVAFILGIMPFTESLQERWWKEVFNWIFMGPAVMGVLLVGSIIVANAPAAILLNNVNDSSLASFNQIAFVATAAITYFIAASIPTMMGGQIMGAVSKKVSGAMKWGGGKAWDGAKYGERRYFGISEAMKQAKDARKESFDKDAQLRGSGLRSKIHQSGPLGRWVAGYKDENDRRLQEHKIREAQLSDIQKGYEGMDYEKVREDYDSPNELRQQAAARFLSGKPTGMVGSNDDGWAKQTEILNKFTSGVDRPKDTTLDGNMFKENPGTYVEMGNVGAVKSLMGKNTSTELKGGHIESMAKLVANKDLAGNDAQKDARKWLRDFTAEDVKKLNKNTKDAFVKIASDTNNYPSDLFSDEVRQALGATNSPRNPMDSAQQSTPRSPEEGGGPSS